MTARTSDKVTDSNRIAWNTRRLSAWNTAFGSAEAEAARIIENPKHTLRRILPYIHQIEDKQICSIQGSHGRIAVAFALLGAHVRVIDFSEENARFALALAAAAGVSIDYTVGDILKAQEYDIAGKFDVLVLELGILHYHQDLDQFFAVLRGLTKDGATLFLNEFHPVQRKLFWQSGPKDYLFDALVNADVPNPNDDGAYLGECQYRFWTMADVVNATISNGFHLLQLDEHPDWDDPTLPGTFSMLAKAVT